MAIQECRSCGGTHLSVILDLKEQPIANALLTPDTAGAPEPVFPLALAFCRDCALLQVTETIPPEVLYRRDYPYFSSSSPALLDHARRHALSLIDRCNLGPDSLIIEVASNDGYLLKNFVERGIPVLGIDPAEGPAARALEIGVPTRNEFFSTALAQSLREEGRLADVVIASNVVAHVDNINDFVEGFARILKPTGRAIFEFAYAVDMIDHCEFDTIYHEHLFYHTVTGLTPLFERHGLHLNDVERLPIHGGSLRLTVGFGTEQSPALRALRAMERERGVDGLAFYRNFADRAEVTTGRLKALLKNLKANGKRIAAYGAAAKGATLVNALGLGAGFFEYVCDRNVHKHGKLMPGQKIPIFGPERLDEDQPDYVLLLVWNFADEVLRDHAEFQRRGGRFIIPVPDPRIVDPAGQRVEAAAVPAGA